MNLVPVVDISEHQGHTDFNVMRSRGVQGLILRCSHAMTRDARVATYYPSALAAGYKPADIGFYSFVNPKRGGGATCARFALEVMWDVAGEPTFYMVDVEDFRNESPNRGTCDGWAGPRLVDWLRAHVDAIRNELPGLPIVFYSNTAYWDSDGRHADHLKVPHVGSPELAAEFDWIVPRYPADSHASYKRHPLPPDATGWEEWCRRFPTGPLEPMGAGDWEGWQFSAGFNGQGRPYGTSSSDLDLNIVRAEAWRRWTVRKPSGPPAEQPRPIDPPEEDDMPIVTNAEQFFDAAPGVAKFALMDDGRLRHLGPVEWAARGSRQGIAWSNAEIATAGIWA